MPGIVFSVALNGHLSASGALAFTIAVPAGAAVGLLASMFGNGSSGGVYAQGSMTDNGGNTYISKGGIAYTQNGGIDYLYSDSFECLNTGSSATQVTYNTPVAYAGNIPTVDACVWVWTVTGGSVTIGTQSSNGQTAPGTGANAITSGSVNCGVGSVIMGLCNDGQGTGALTAGAGFTTDFSNFNVYSDHGPFSASQAATWTTTVGTDPKIMTQALSFGFSTGGGSGQPQQSLPLTGVSVLAPLAWVIRRRQIRAKERNAGLRQWKRDDSSGLILPEYKKVA